MVLDEAREGLRGAERGTSLQTSRLIGSAWIDGIKWKVGEAPVKITSSLLVLNTHRVFRISRSKGVRFENLLIRVEDGGEFGLGEAAPSEYFGETPELVQKGIEKISDSIQINPMEIQAIGRRLDDLIPESRAAKSAVMMAVYDLVCKRLKVPLYRFLGLDPTSTPLTSFTLGIDDPYLMKERALEAMDFPILKVKLGVDSDMDIIHAVREVTDRPIRADVNGAWTVTEAISKIDRLADLGVELIEQPIYAGDLEGYGILHEKSPLPIFVDESVMVAEDIPKLAGKVDGINIKLVKCGGIWEALRMVHVARACGLKVIVGCMIESSIGITAAAHISPLVDYADLDGNLLLLKDPFAGVTVEHGKILLPREWGLGVRKREFWPADG
jgi:L-alanine-DL-glutamate epimerase-like enolase superfamily enzyme